MARQHQVLSNIFWTCPTIYVKKSNYFLYNVSFKNSIGILFREQSSWLKVTAFPLKRNTYGNIWKSEYSDNDYMFYNKYLCVKFQLIRSMGSKGICKNWFCWKSSLDKKIFVKLSSNHLLNLQFSLLDLLSGNRSV